MIDFFLQACVAIASMFAGMFWMASAYGHTVTPPWRNSHPVPEHDRPSHQAKWERSRRSFSVGRRNFSGNSDTAGTSLADASAS